MEGDFLHLDTEADTSLEDLDFDQLRHERFERNRHFLESVNPGVAAKVFPGHEHEGRQLSVREKAAVTIQRFWRGLKGRQLYVTALLEKFEKEEEKQKEKVQYQMEEGELLVENRQLEVLLDDSKTTRRNAGRLYISKIITIQRAWRAYLEKQVSWGSRINHGNQSDRSNSTKILVKRLNPFDTVTGELNIADDNLEKSNVADKIEENVNDENCMFNPLGEIVNEESNTELPPFSRKTTNENIQPLSPRQQRKHNFLNKAQQFAELKKLNSRVLPFDLHLHIDRRGHSESQGVDIEGAGTMSTAMPPSIVSGQKGEPCPNDNIKQSSFSETRSKVLTGATCDKDYDSSKGANCGEDMVKHLPKGTNSSTEGSNSFICDKHHSESQHICDTKESNSETQSKEGNSVCDTKGCNSCQKEGEEKNKSSPTKTTSSGQTDEVVNAFDVYNIETALPDMDWSSLEEKLKAASEEARKIQEARRNDREEIRKKLAMGGEDGLDDDDDDDDEITYKKPNIQSRLHSGLQICFMNESPGDTDNEGLSPRQHEIHDNAKLMKKVSKLVDSDNNLSSVTDLNNPEPPDLVRQSSSPPRLKLKDDAKPKDFHSRQEQLQNEAKMALAQAGSMAHMQLEIEKQLKKKSPMAEMVGIPGLGEKHRKQLSIRQLQQMNLASIQVLYNDLQTQIESLNEELVHLLMERDELHMAQDSMLVDIEDLTRRAEELAERANMTGGNKGNKTNNKGKVSTR